MRCSDCGRPFGSSYGHAPYCSSQLPMLPQPPMRWSPVPVFELSRDEGHDLFAAEAQRLGVDPEEFLRLDAMGEACEVYEHEVWAQLHMLAPFGR